jgi:hypothetical protein
MEICKNLFCLQEWNVVGTFMLLHVEDSYFSLRAFGTKKVKYGTYF